MLTKPIWHRKCVNLQVRWRRRTQRISLDHTRRKPRWLTLPHSNSYLWSQKICQRHRVDGIRISSKRLDLILVQMQLMTRQSSKWSPSILIYWRESRSQPNKTDLAHRQILLITFLVMQEWNLTVNLSWSSRKIKNSRNTSSTSQIKFNLRSQVRSIVLNHMVILQGHMDAISLSSQQWVHRRMYPISRLSSQVSKPR